MGRGPFPGVDGATPSSRAQSQSKQCVGRPLKSCGLSEATSNGYPQGSRLEGAAPSAPVERRDNRNGRATSIGQALRTGGALQNLAVGQEAGSQLGVRDVLHRAALF